MVKQFLCLFIVNYNTMFDLKKILKKKKRIRKIILSILVLLRIILKKVKVK